MHLRFFSVGIYHYYLANFNIFRLNLMWVFLLKLKNNKTLLFSKSFVYNIILIISLVAFIIIQFYFKSKRKVFVLFIKKRKLQLHINSDASQFRYGPCTTY